MTDKQMAILRAKFPNAPQSFFDRQIKDSLNYEARISNENKRPSPVVERYPSHAPLDTEKVQRPVGQRLLVRVTSVRNRLLDEDNLCEKYAVDLCRFASIIPDDSPAEVKIEVSQRKVEKGEPEHTLIEVFE